MSSHLAWSEGAWGEGDESAVVAASGTSTALGAGASFSAAPGSAAGTSTPTGLSPPGIEIGRARVRQKVYHDPLETESAGSLTTWATDLAVASISTGGDTLTFAEPHEMIVCEGPYTIDSTGNLLTSTPAITETTKLWVIRDSSTVIGLAISGQNARAGTRINITNAGTGTHTLRRRITTHTTGSAFMLMAALGTWALTPEAPTDNMANTFSALAGSPISYAAFAAARAGCWAVAADASVGGAGHTASKTWSDENAPATTSSDEPTIAILEIVGGRFIKSATQKETAIGSATITSNAVVTTAPAILVGVIFGNGPIGQDHVWTWGDSFVQIDECSSTADTSANGYIQICVAYKEVSAAGSYTFSASGISNEGGQMYLFAFQSMEPTGVSAGTSTVAAVATSTAAAAGSAAGTSTVGGVAPTPSGVGDAAGTSAVAGVGTAITSASGAATGTSTVTGVGAASAASPAAASGTGAPVAVGASAAGAAGSAAGSSGAAAAGTSTASSAGAAAGTSPTTGAGAAASTAAGSAAGTSAPIATGAAVASGLGASAGTSTAGGTGAATVAGVGSAAGVGDASSAAVSQAAGAAAGASTAAGAGASSSASAGAASGSSSATAVGRALVEATGSSAGLSDAQAAGASGYAGQGVAAGSSAASGIGAALATGAGAAAGASTAEAVSGDPIDPLPRRLAAITCTTAAIPLIACVTTAVPAIACTTEPPPAIEAP